MAFVRINPAYRDFLRSRGLVTPNDFLKLPTVIVGGHADRNVGRVLIGDGPEAIAAFLKREHRLRWKDRLANALRGFGLCSKSVREFQTLRAAEQAGMACPEWMAVGETELGQAFLLLRELPETVDLRVFLYDLRGASVRRRQRFARRLGITLAQIHCSGFDHPDLYAKHVLVQAESGRLFFVDWQRSRWRRPVSWRQRCRDLAALDATLATDLLPVPERILCLRAYLRSCRAQGDGGGGGLLPVAFRVFRKSRRLVRQRRIREMQPVPRAKQQLVWLDGEALCVTPAFQEALPGALPDWLQLSRLPAHPGQFVHRNQVRLEGLAPLLLVRRRMIRPWAGIWAWLRGRRLTSPELSRAGEIFRLQRAGMVAERLLAFGQRCPVPWRIESFLLTQPQEEMRGESLVASDENQDLPRTLVAQESLP